MRPHLTVEQRRLALRLKARGAQFQESSRRRCGRQRTRSASVASGHCPASPSWRIAAACREVHALAPVGGNPIRGDDAAFATHEL
jgi:hypothetical protein